MTNSCGFTPSEAYFSKEVYSKELKTYKVVERNMIAFNPSRINVGSVALQDKADEVIVSPLYVVFSVDERRLLPEYVVRFLKSKPGLRQIAARSIGTVRNNLKYDALCRMEMNLPSLEDQQTQLAALSLVEKQISAQKAMISYLQSLVKSRFVEMFGDLGSNINKWEKMQFETFAAIDTQMTNDFERYANAPHIGIDCIENGTGKIFGYKTVSEDNVRSGKYLFTPRHIIYSKIRPALNKVALPNFSGVCSADAYPILPNQENCDRIFLAHAMRSNYFLDYILPLSTRAQIPKVNKDALRGFAMPLPPLPLQREFAAFAGRAAKLEFVARQQIEKLQTLYDSLAQEYFG